MAKKLNTLPNIPIARHPGIYPWHEWLDGSIWQLEQGTDFTMKTAMMQTYILNKIRRTGLNLQVSRRGNLIFISPRG